MPSPWGRLVDNISSKLAFFPPDPPSYAVESSQDGDPEAMWLQTEMIPRVHGCDAFKLQTEKRKAGGGGEEIVCVMVSNRSAKKTLLYSHGNAVDLGQMQPFFRDLADQLRVNIIGYDYSGYGQSSGVVSVNNTIADIDAVYKCLQEKYGMKPADIVLYGQSVGTGPSTDLAAREPGLGGLVLHSPLMSGIRVLNPNLKRWPDWADVYPNLTLMPKVECPTTILHGSEDDVIGIEHGHRLHELCKNPAAPLWLEGYNHQNLELSPMYLPHLREFLARLD
mmetsp:Transcript_14510/g.40862  ORF Transcript_14510/g.40862 Transcript_14510/m.40862 type:complete len:279 (-) Transcript_14510:34-870(-)